MEQFAQRHWTCTLGELILVQDILALEQSRQKHIYLLVRSY